MTAGDGLNQGPQAPEPPRHHWFIYVHPGDVAQAVQAALLSPLAHGCFNIRIFSTGSWPLGN